MSKNKTFSVMVKEVEEALQALRDAEHEVEEASRAMLASRAYRDRCRTNLQRLRDELFREHPELSEGLVSKSDHHAGQIVAPVAAPEPVSSPQGPVVFRDRDDFDSPFGGGEG